MKLAKTDCYKLVMGTGEIAYYNSLAMAEDMKSKFGGTIEKTFRHKEVS